MSHPNVDAPPSRDVATTNGRPLPHPSALDLADRLDSARAAFHSATESMGRASDAMRMGGTPPDYRLIHELGECHRLYLRLRDEVVGHAQSLGQPVPQPDHLGGLDALRALLDALPLAPAATPPEALAVDAEPLTHPPTETAIPTLAHEPIPDHHVDPAPPIAADPEELAPGTVEIATQPDPPFAEPAYEETPPAAMWVEPVREPEPPPVFEPEPTVEAGSDVRDAALAVLDKVARLAVRTGADMPELDACRRQALGLRERIAQGDVPDAESLATGEHPIARLIRIVEGKDDLNDGEWATFHSTLSAAFGRPLAVAAARGRLMLTP